MLTEGRLRRRDRDREIVEAYRRGEDVKNIAESYGLTGARVYQVLNSLSADAIAALYKERKDGIRNAALWEKVQQRVNEATVCPVCECWNLRGKKRVTCSKECAGVWSGSGARYLLDDEVYQKRRISQARSVLRHAQNRSPQEVNWAMRVLSGEPPNRRFVVKGSRAASLVEKVRPDRIPK